MGSDTAYPEEAPTRERSVAGFWIDTHEVTNRQFARFVDETGYVTSAELVPDPACHPDIDPALLVPGSAVFKSPDTPDGNWWNFVADTTWRTPEGPGSNISERMDHPVVHVSYRDALAYAAWAGGDLPTEEEWEYAARDGLDSKIYQWGNVSPNQEGSKANIWEGEFPFDNTAEDGFLGTAPVGCYDASRYGLYDMTGNVWEWVKAGQDRRRSVIKGGSFLCAENYCHRFRPSARQWQEQDFSTSHIGFRLVYR
jgi:formylglycine-generating enzyme required for sulfatase activity